MSKFANTTEAATAVVTATREYNTLLGSVASGVALQSVETAFANGTLAARSLESLTQQVAQAKRLNAKIRKDQRAA